MSPRQEHVLRPQQQEQGLLATLGGLTGLRPPGQDQVLATPTKLQPGVKHEADRVAGVVEFKKRHKQ